LNNCFLMEESSRLGSTAYSCGFRSGDCSFKIRGAMPVHKNHAKRLHVVQSLCSALAIALLFACVPSSHAATISFGGLISQSTGDGTGPAVDNPALNLIADGDAYTVQLIFSGSLAGLGALNPVPGASLAFTDGSITENSFSSVFLTVSADSNPSLYDVSLLGCLSTGSGCGVGNDLAANFAVSAADFNSSNVPATFIPGLVPSLDLLEDDGVTDIQGTVANFSNSSPRSPIPEPPAAGLLCTVLATIAWIRFYRSTHKRSTSV